jgi:hypothetical protein
MQPDAQAPESEEVDQEVDPQQIVEQPDEVLLEWQIQDTTPEHKSTLWYVILGLIAAVIIVIAVFTQTWAVIPLGVLVPWALSIYTNRGIGDHSYELATFHVAIDGKPHPYTNFKSFFTVTTGKLTTFELVPAKRFGQLTTLHANEEDVEDVADILTSVLPETEPQGYTGESFFKRLKF